MRRATIISLLLFFSTSTLVLAQEITIRGKVVDAETEQPLSYAHLIFKEVDLGTSTDIAGIYRFRLPEKFLGEKVQVSYVGYKNKVVGVEDLQNGLIALTPDVEFLNEVNIVNMLHETRKVIRPHWNRKIVGLGNLNGGLYPSILARYYERPERFDQGCFIEEIKIYFFETAQRYNFSPKFRLHIYDVGPSGKPGRELLRNRIVEKPSGKSAVEVNLLSERIQINKNGFFVGVEHLFIPENRYKEVTNFYINDSLVAKEYAVEKYGPIFRGTLKKRKKYSQMYYYRPEGWTRIENWNLLDDFFDNRIPSLVFKIILTD